jgi:chromosome partitioning protein
MRMQLRLNQFRAAKRAAPTAKIFNTQIRDAMVVRRSVALGLPVILVGSEGADSADSVTNDYRKLAAEIAQHEVAG